MTKRRMFSLQIVDTDAFLDMPISAQALYFHLVMRADDEGFIGNPKKIMRLMGAQDDDLKVLLTKRFVLAFNSGVVVIKHWLIHNTIRMDRFCETTYLEEKQQLTLKENKSYTELATSWQPNGNQLATQYNISKDNIIEDKLNTADKSAENITLIFKEFEEINPTINYGNKTQRKACKELIEKFGLEKVINTLKYYKSIRNERFSPTISTPYVLQQKLGDLMNYYNKHQTNNKTWGDAIKL